MCTIVSASNANPLWTNSQITAVVSATDDYSGIEGVRYNIGSDVFDPDCTTGGTATSDGASITMPAGGTTLYLCARDFEGNTASWNGEYNWENTPPSAPGKMTTTWTGDHYITGEFVAETTGSTDAGGSGISHYALYRSVDNSLTCNILVETDIAGTSYIVTGADLPSEDTYRYYCWMAHDNAGNASSMSETEYVRMDAITPTNTPTPTPTDTPIPTDTPTPTPTDTPVPTDTPTPTPTDTPIPTDTPTPTPTVTPTLTPTMTPTITPTLTPTLTPTPTITPTLTPVISPTPTMTLTPTLTPTVSIVGTVTPVPSVPHVYSSVLPTPTGQVTVTPSIFVSETPIADSDEKLKLVTLHLVNLNGNPLVNTKVQIDGKDYKTNSDGNIKLTEVNVGKHILKVLIGDKLIEQEIFIGSDDNVRQITVNDTINTGESINSGIIILCMALIVVFGIIVLVKRKKKQNQESY